MKAYYTYFLLVLSGKPTELHFFTFCLAIPILQSISMVDVSGKQTCMPPPFVIKFGLSDLTILSDKEKWTAKCNSFACQLVHPLWSAFFSQSGLLMSSQHARVSKTVLFASLWFS